MMFIWPMFPDDVLCFIAGLSSMSTKYFFVMILISRLISIAGTCYSFEFIPLNTWWGLLLWGVIIAAIGTAFFFVYKNVDRIQEWIQSRKTAHNSKKKNHTDMDENDEAEGLNL